MSDRNSEYDISEDKASPADKKNRGSRLRRCNIRMLTASVVVLMALCAVQSARIRALDMTIVNLNAQVSRLNKLAAQQQEEILLLSEALQDGEGTGGAGGGSTDNGQTDAGEDAVEANAVPEITAAHKVYLTFDDGPSVNTQAILDILDEYGVKATFFVVGKEGETAEESMRKIVEAGHTIGIHSYSHDYGELYASLESFAEDFAKAQEHVYEVTGVKSTVYRFPGGSSNTLSQIDMREFARYLDSQGVSFYDWNVSSGDGGSYLFPTETIIENCTKNIESNGTSIVLMHDRAGKSTTLEALPTIIEMIQEMEDTVILPITEETDPIQHIDWKE